MIKFFKKIIKKISDKIDRDYEERQKKSWIEKQIEKKELEKLYKNNWDIKKW